MRRVSSLWSFREGPTKSVIYDFDCKMLIISWSRDLERWEGLNRR
jgi:hypothetical protein